MTNILDLPYDQIEWSRRSHDCMRNQGVVTIRDLTELTATDLMDWPNFYRKSLSEVREQLRRHGLILKGDRMPRPYEIPVLPNAARDLSIWARWRAGERKAHLARAFGLSRVRVAQICWHGDQRLAKQRLREERANG